MTGRIPRPPYVVLTKDGVVAEPQRLTHHAWKLLTAVDFAERMTDWITCWPHQGSQQSFLIAEYTDAGEYLPYAQGITKVITRGLIAITPAPST